MRYYDTFMYYCTNRVPEVTIHHTEKIGKIILLSTQFS